MSVIQESKMQASTILMILESNEVLRIQERFKVQRTNETLKIEDWRTIEGSRIWAKFEDLRKRNLHVYGTACQREVHEYDDQNVTKVLVYWKISFDEDATSQQHLVDKVFWKGEKC